MDKYEESALRIFILKEIVEITSVIANWSREDMDGRDLAALMHRTVLGRFEEAERRNAQLLHELKEMRDLQGKIKPNF